MVGRKCQGHIVAHSPPRQESRRLKGVREPGRPRAMTDATFKVAIETGDDIEQRGLAAARWTGDRDERSSLHGEFEALEDPQWPTAVHDWILLARDVDRERCCQRRHRFAVTSSGCRTPTSINCTTMMKASAYARISETSKS